VPDETPRPPEVVREKISPAGQGRVACALIFDREFSGPEVSRFYAQRRGAGPSPGDFEMGGRVVRYECTDAEEPRWRLAAEIYLVKCFRPGPRRRASDHAGQTRRPPRADG
jgi:hypothetical protein